MYTMFANIKMPQSIFYTIVIACSTLIFCESIQVLWRSGNPEYFELWGEKYMLVLYGHFFERITVPVLLALYTYVSFAKIRVGKLFCLVWEVMLIGGVISCAMEQDFSNILYYIKLIAYGVNMIILLKLWQVIDDEVQDRKLRLRARDEELVNEHLV
ncbi:MAG: hypothetical protein ATN31_06240 [Candidatus Epulonipiscioides saccharophilum]|nr:MAG: hypothetical protein ATN31_06240 [Epulopiscium sp. AS2M-Bin001]